MEGEVGEGELGVPCGRVGGGYAERVHLCVEM